MNMEKTAKISTATALQMEETSYKPTNPISAWYAKLKNKFSSTSNATSTSISIFQIRRFCKTLSKAFVTCIIFYCLGIFFPELREAIPGFYHLVDLFLTGADACFGALADLLQWLFSLLQ